MAQAETEAGGSAKFDVYARPFVPQALRLINEVPVNTVSCAPAPWIDFDAYVRAFAGSAFLSADTFCRHNHQQFPDLSGKVESGTNTQKDSSGNGTVPATLDFLHPQNYQDFFDFALKLEYDGLCKECEDHALFKWPLLKASPQKDPRPFMYSEFISFTHANAFLSDRITALTVPGLREMSLRIEIGDTVQLRQIRFDRYGKINCVPVLTDNYGKPLGLPKYPDNQHNSVVWGIDRLRETLSLRVDALLPWSMLFNVCFTVQSRRIGSVWRAATDAQHALTTSDGGWLRSMLFPKPSDGAQQNALNKARIGLKLHDQLLNYEQQRAVHTVLKEAYGLVPYIISGPPGTGKTKTLVELALQLLSKNKASHLLMCAPSDPAADTLTQRLSKHLKPRQLLRLNSPSRSFPEVPDNLLSFSCIDNEMFSLPSFEELMRVQIVVTTCHDAEILRRARVTNRDLFHLENSLRNIIHPNTEQSLPSLHWTALLIDEAAQATEIEALIPLLVVAPPEHEQISHQLPAFVMAGDQHQLGPRTASKTTALQKSLFERLLDSEFYSAHPLARSKQSGGIMRPLTQDMLPIIRPAFTNLIRNYRSHSAILAIPSSLFYNDTLEPEARGTDALITFPDWKGRKWPLLFVSHRNSDDVEQDGGGWYNVQEAQIACWLACSFLDSGLLQAHEICIMSPFGAQVRLLRKIARAAPFSMHGVSIGPLEAFQGLESRLVILCTTRTRNRFIDQDIAKGLGVIHEPKRFNVALTRAKEGLIVIGNPEVLEQDKNWTAFMSFCHRNGLWDARGGLQWKPPLGHDVPSARLERQILREETHDEQVSLVNGVRTLGFPDDEESLYWRSGVAVAELLERNSGDEAALENDFDQAEG